MDKRDNLTAVLYEAKDLRLEQRPIPVPKDDEVLLQMDSVGICGSDVHYFTRGRIGQFIVRKPMVIGHEASGKVVQLGKNVTTLKVGDRVAIEPGVSCRMCRMCKGGRYNLCPDMSFCATPPVDGNLTRYYVHAADFCHKLPDHVSMDEGAMLEPLSVGVHACRRACVTLGSMVLVLGAGPIGLVTLLTAKAMGASKVIITDMIQHRLDIAKTCGADHVLLVEKDDDEKSLSKKIEGILRDAPDITIDCGGFQSTIRLAIEVTRPGGVVVLVGMGAEEVTIPLVEAAIKEVDVKGIFRYANDYPLALAMVSTGKVNLKPLITHKYSLEETLKAFDVASKGTGNPIKIILKCRGETTSTFDR